MIASAYLAHRRDFLRHVGALAACVGATQVSLGGVHAPAIIDMPIIDTHQHLWDLKKLKLPWLKDYSALAKSYLPSDYAKAIEGTGVVQSVYMEVDVEASQQDAEAEYVIGICREGKTTMAAAVISGRPELDSFGDYIRKYKNEKAIKGIRRLIDAAGITPEVFLGKTFVANIRLLGELGMSFDLHPRVAELAEAAKLADACPDTRFVLDHCGCIAPTADESVRKQWRKGLAEVAKRKNVVCKISGIIANAPEKWTTRDLAPIINPCLDEFGPDRVMFASDWPVCSLRATLGEWVVALKEIVADRSAEDQKKLFHDNAAAFYKLAKKS